MEAISPGPEAGRAGPQLLVSEVDGLPGAAFTVRCLPREAWHAHGGDVLVRLLPDTGSTGQPAVLAGVWAVLGGHLILTAATGDCPETAI